MKLSQPRPTATPDPSTPITRGALRFAMLGGGIAWLSHLLLSYVIAEFGCVSGLGHEEWAGVSPVIWLLVAMTVGTLGLAMAATVVAFRNSRALRRPGTAASESREAELFAARFGLILDSLFVLVIVVQSVPIVYFWGPC